MAVCDWCQRELPPASKKASNVRRFCSDKHRQLAYRWRKNYPNVTVWGKDPAGKLPTAGSPSAGDRSGTDSRLVAAQTASSQLAEDDRA